MTAPRFSKWFSKCLAAGLLMVAGNSELRADEFYDTMDTSIYVDNTDHDLQFFSPVDFDFENQPIQINPGYFFRYDKLSWAFTGERESLGADEASLGSLGPWRRFVSGFEYTLDQDDNIIIIDPGVPIDIPPPALLSGIESGPPRSTFAWGERYEFGINAEETSWSIGILDGPGANDSKFYGGQLTQDPIFGAVIVNFADPLFLMRGFMDVIGPIGDPFQPDGRADDVNLNGQYGPDGIDAEAPGREPDTIVVGLPPDFDDLVILPTSFSSLSVRNFSETQGVELMKTHRLDNRHRMVKNQNHMVEFGYGVRYLRLEDEFNVFGTGGVMGTSFWDTSVMNNLVGPQVLLNWVSQHKRLKLDLGSRCMFAYNIQNLQQEVSLGEDLLPGQYNRPLYMGPTVANHGKQEEEFSPVVELRAQASYQITRALAARLGYTATFVDNIRRASAQVKYELPNMGFRDEEITQDIFINGVNFGCDVVY
jgi:hypothetical protein